MMNEPGKWRVRWTEEHEEILVAWSEGQAINEVLRDRREQCRRVIDPCASSVEEEQRQQERAKAEQTRWLCILQAATGGRGKAIILDEENVVVHSDFATDPTVSPSIQPHLLDVVDNQQQDFLRLVGQALDRPNQVVETDVVFRKEPYHVRAACLDAPGGPKRTIILFESSRNAHGDLHGRGR